MSRKPVETAPGYFFVPEQPKYVLVLSCRNKYNNDYGNE
mgnify:CR=1 FL=1